MSFYKEINNLVIDGTKCSLGCMEEGLYAYSNFANLEGKMKTFEWRDESSYGMCTLYVETVEQLELVMNAVNEYLDTEFSIVRVDFESKSEPSKYKSVQDVIFKSKEKELFKTRLCVLKNGTYGDDFMEQRDRNFVMRVSAIIYWLFVEKGECEA